MVGAADEQQVCGRAHDAAGWSEQAAAPGFCDPHLVGGCSGTWLLVAALRVGP